MLRIFLYHRDQAVFIILSGGGFFRVFLYHRDQAIFIILSGDRFFRGGLFGNDAAAFVIFGGNGFFRVFLHDSGIAAFSILSGNGFFRGGFFGNRIAAFSIFSHAGLRVFFGRFFYYDSGTFAASSLVIFLYRIVCVLRGVFFIPGDFGHVNRGFRPFRRCAGFSFLRRVVHGDKVHHVAAIRMMMLFHAANRHTGNLVAGRAVLMSGGLMLLRNPVCLTANKLRYGNIAADNGAVSIIAGIAVFMHLRIIAGQCPYFAVAVSGMVMSSIDRLGRFGIENRIAFCFAAGQAQHNGVASVGMVMPRNVLQTADQIAIFIIAIGIVLMEIGVFRKAAKRVSFAVQARRSMEMNLEIGNEMAFLRIYRSGFFQAADQRPFEARVGMLMLRQAANQLPLCRSSRYSASSQQHHGGCQNSEHPADSFAHFIPLHLSSLQTNKVFSVFGNCGF